MSSLSRKKGKAQQPTSREGIPSVLLDVRETLYSTASLESFVKRIKGGPKAEFPWSNFVEANQAIKKNDKATAISLLKQITAAEGLATRVHLQAWHSLRSLGELPPDSLCGQIQSFIIEKHMDGGLDIIAAYADHTARYWNYTGAGIAWDVRDPDIDPLIDNLLSVGQEIMKTIGTDPGEKLPIPAQGNVRLFMAGFDGSCLGEGPSIQLVRDPMAGYAIGAGNNLMMGILGKAKKSFK